MSNQKIKACEYCDDGDGGCIFPYFGLAPHIHAGKHVIGSTQLLDQSQWPANFSPDMDEDDELGTGVYTHCLNCGGDGTCVGVQLEAKADEEE